jgi:hypothetical protein
MGDMSDIKFLNELESEVHIICIEQLQLIQEDAEQILREAIQSRVYDYYQPTYFTPRGSQLKDNVKSELRVSMVGDTLYVYVDTTALDFESHYSMENVSNLVPKWVNEGHMDETGIDNQFHSYEGRQYLQEALEELRIKYEDQGFIVTLDDD